jgi:hypothetical protein
MDPMYHATRGERNLQINYPWTNQASDWAVAEVITWNRALDAKEITAASHYLMAKKDKGGPPTRGMEIWFDFSKSPVGGYSHNIAWRVNRPSLLTSLVNPPSTQFNSDCSSENYVEGLKAKQVKQRGCAYWHQSGRCLAALSEGLDLALTSASFPATPRLSRSPAMAPQPLSVVCRSVPPPSRHYLITFSAMS